MAKLTAHSLNRTEILVIPSTDKHVHCFNTTCSSYLLGLPFNLSSENYKEDEARLRFSVRARPRFSSDRSCVSLN